MLLKIKITCILSLGELVGQWLHIVAEIGNDVLSQVVNTSSRKRCWSTYNFIYDVKRNRLNLDQANSLVYVHYNLRLLFHYSKDIKNNKLL